MSGHAQVWAYPYGVYLTALEMLQRGHQASRS